VSVAAGGDKPPDSTRGRPFSDNLRSFCV